MKICYLSNAKSPHTKKWCKYFSEKKHDVHLISFDDGYIENVTVHHIDINVTRESSRFKKIAYLFCGNKVNEIINKIEPDIIHAHRATGYAYLASKSNFHPYILSVWGADVFELPKNPVYKLFIKKMLMKPDYLFSTSNAMKMQVKKLVDRDIIVTPFGVDTNLFKKHETNKKTEKIVIGTVKTLRKEYGIEYLIRAFKVIIQANPQIKLELQIAGRGAEEANLKKLCKDLKIDDRVKFLGYLSQEEVVEMLNKIDVAVFPSIGNESFGVAAVEAQACGLPVVVSDIGGLPEATNPGYSSILVRPGDYDQLANVLNKLVRHKKLRDEMSINAREYIVKNYDINENFGSVEKIYMNIMKENL